MNQEKDVLHEVIGFRSIPENPERYPPDQAGIAAEKDGQRFPAALANLTIRISSETSARRDGGAPLNFSGAFIRFAVASRKSNCRETVHNTLVPSEWWFVPFGDLSLSRPD